MRWVLLLRAVNLGPRNKLAMKDLRAVLEELGYEDVKTVLNSGNATFSSSRRSAQRVADDVEQELAKKVGLSVRAAVVTPEQVRKALEEVPKDFDGYVVVSVLLGKPDRAGLARLEAWEPEAVRAGDGVLYLSYPRVQGSRLTPALIEKELGVATTGRTPATLRKLL